MENAANASKIFWDLLRSSYFAKSEVLRRLVNNTFLVFLCVRFWSFLSWYHLQCACNKLETEAGTLHGICYILPRFAWFLNNLASVPKWHALSLITLLSNYLRVVEPKPLAHVTTMAYLEAWLAVSMGYGSWTSNWLSSAWPASVPLFGDCVSLVVRRRAYKRHHFRVWAYRRLVARNEIFWIEFYVFCTPVYRHVKTSSCWLLPVCPCKASEPKWVEQTSRILLR